ncbi:Cytochrome oxidase assembly protein ShyY1 [Onishia taeanensis]|uniref:SURF1-like protein n=1 Tax=Onishia taeanensis TaxID=284577 RepID=A0A1G7QJD7_9GAMM|nr:Cytochrome oxidase assembly protein ShyY1 [Halomonas taeanensis]
MGQNPFSSSKRAPTVKVVLLWWGFWSLLVILGLALGQWQWQRAAEKEAYLAALAAAPTLVSPQEAPPEGATLILEGRYQADETRFLDNRTHDGELGVAALTPLRGDDGRLWLIERGFMPTGVSREAPSVATPEGRVTLKGQWQQDGKRAPLFGANQEGLRLQRIQLDAWKDLGGFAQAGWLHLEEGPGLLKPWWEPSVLPPSRHLGYAVQWWGLAAAALVVLLLGGRRMRLARQPVQVSTPVSERAPERVPEYAPEDIDACGQQETKP